MSPQAILVHQWVCATKVHIHTNTLSLIPENTVLFRCLFLFKFHPFPGKAILIPLRQYSALSICLITSFPVIAHNISCLYSVRAGSTSILVTQVSPGYHEGLVWPLALHKSLNEDVKKSIFFHCMMLLIESVVCIFYLVDYQKIFQCHIICTTL